MPESYQRPFSTFWYLITVILTGELELCNVRGLEYENVKLYIRYVLCMCICEGKWKLCKVKF